MYHKIHEDSIKYTNKKLQNILSIFVAKLGHIQLIIYVIITYVITF